MADTNTVNTTATTVDSTVDMPMTQQDILSMLNVTGALSLVSELKQLTETEATKRIDKMSAAEAITLSSLILSKPVREVLKTKLGEATAKHLVHTISTKVQLATYEADDTARIQSLGSDDEGWGVYAQQAPLGGFGVEIGVVRQETKDGSFTTQRGAAGVYLRASDETRPNHNHAATKAGADALAALLG